MTQTTIGSYVVQQGEDVTIEVVATQVNEFAKAALDDGDLEPSNAAPLRYTFTASKPPGEEHFFVIQVAFDATAGDGAKYELFVQGAAGGGRFTDFTIRKSSQELSRTIVFAIA